jgi:beta-lactamase regulating signal transducer with metallopeptidase domain
VLTLFWWNPVAWWARRQLHRAEEECCDAWVLSALPERSREYAGAILETLDFLSGAQPVMPAFASGLGAADILERRLKMILYWP